MNKAQLHVLNDAERLLVLETDKPALAALDEDALVDLHTRIRRARGKYVGQYRRGAASRVRDVGGRGKAKAQNQRARRQGGDLRGRPGPGELLAGGGRQGERRHVEGGAARGSPRGEGEPGLRGTRSVGWEGPGRQPLAHQDRDEGARACQAERIDAGCRGPSSGGPRLPLILSRGA